MRFGVCYYPEQWPEERWELDARLMRETGLELVRIGEFAWSSYEPLRNEFRWDWLDRAVETLTSNGLQIVLGTPTATPPVWLAREQPEILSVGSDGRRRTYGSRRHTCPTAQAYRQEASRIVSAVVERYGQHEGVVAWQVDNEPGNHDSARCWCDLCQEAFTSWLRDRYRDIAHLNRAWGTSFWSQTYPDFESVRLPVPTVTSHHPSLLLAHRRFASHQVVSGLAEQVRIINSGAPGRDVFSNVYSGDIDLDAAALSGLGGIFAVDSYPHGVEGPWDVALTVDRRPGGSATRLWVMEQQIGPINWGTINAPVPTGQVRLWIWQAALHGVETMFFFRWRAALSGQEQFHSGLLRHDGSPSAALAEVAATIAELRSVQLTKESQVGLLFSNEDSWQMEIAPHRQGLTHRSLLLTAYTACRSLGLGVEVVDPAADLSRYSIVLAPALQITNSARIRALEGVLAAGNLVVLGPRALSTNDEGVFTDRARPGGLTDRLRATIVEGLSQREELMIDPWMVPSGPWTDVLETTGADVIARYGGSGHLAGKTAAVRSSNLVYAGFSSVEAWTSLLADLTGLTPDDRERFLKAGWALDHMDLQIRAL